MASKTNEPVNAKSDNATVESEGLISNEKLRALYATMLKCRMLEERALHLRSEKAAKPAWGVGQEAVTVATAIDLKAGDAMGPMPGSIFAGLFQDLQIETAFAKLPVSLELKIVTAEALKNKTKKNGAIVAAYLSDEAASLEAWDDLLHAAVANDLPMLFVFPHSSQTHPAVTELRAKADVYGLPRIVVDGCDAAAVYRVASEAMGRARKGFGPTLIDCCTYRLHGSTNGKQKHSDADGSGGHDPIAAMERYLTGKRLFTAEWKQEMVDGFNAELDAVVAPIE